MYAEITLELFCKIVPVNKKPFITQDKEHYIKTIYIVDDVQIIVINNYLSCVTQYYVRDINA